MPLKAVLESLDDVPEALHEHYKEQEDVFVLAVEGIDSHPAVKNLKSAHERTKASLKETKEALQEAGGKLEAFGELTTEELEELREKAEQAATGAKKPNKEELNKMVEERYKIDRAKIEKQLEATAKEAEEFKVKYQESAGQLSQERIFNKIKDAAVKQGVRSKALGIVTDMAKSVWKLDEDGNPVAYNGDEPMMGATGPVSMEDWVGSLAEEHDYLFEPNRGGGAQGGDKPANSGTGAPKIIPPDQAGAHVDQIASGEAVIGDQ